MAISSSFAGERQIIDMMKLRGWEYQARPEPATHQEITFRSQLPTLLYNGGAEHRPVTFHYDRDMYFRKSGVALFISSATDKVAFYKGWPDSKAELKEANIHPLNEFWGRLDDMAGEMKGGGMPVRSLPNPASVWQAVQATSEATNQYLVSKAAARAAPKIG